MKATYLLVLLAIVAITLPLEIFLHTRVYSRWPRLLATLAPVFILFCAWDVWAIARHHWSYDEAYMTGVVLPGRLPLEEALFFVVVPVAAILAFEAVRAVTRWPAGDEHTGGEP